MKRKTLIREWWTAKLGLIGSVLLIEGGHHLLPWGSGAIVVIVGWWVLFVAHGAVWRRWRLSELDRIRSGLLRGREPTLSLLLGEDLRTGQVAVVNDRGFVVAPERPFPPPARLSWVTGFMGDGGHGDDDRVGA